MDGNPPYGRLDPASHSEGYLVWRPRTLVTTKAQRDASATSAIKEHQSELNEIIVTLLPPKE